MKSPVLLSLSALLLLSAAHAQQPSAPASVPTPVDVPASNFARDAVDVLIKRGIILGYPDGTFRGQQPVSRYELAVILARVLSGNLLTTPSAQAALQPGDLDVITRGMQDVAAQISTIDMRLRDALTDIDALRARLGDTERALEGVIAVAVTRSELEAWSIETQARIDAALGTKADQDQVAALQAQVAELQAQVKANQEKLNPPAPEFSVTPENVPNATFTDEPSTPSTSSTGGMPLYVGAGVAYTPGAKTGYTVMVGSDRVTGALGGLGLRVSADLGGTSGFAAQANLTRGLGGDGRFAPYAGLGAGVFVSPEIVASSEDTQTRATVNDVYLSVLTGTTYNFTDSLRLFAEADARYALSTKGEATGNAAFGLKLRGGVKLFF